MKRFNDKAAASPHCIPVSPYLSLDQCTRTVSALVGVLTIDEPFVHQGIAKTCIRIARHPFHRALHFTVSTVRSTNPRQKTSTSCPARPCCPFHRPGGQDSVYPVPRARHGMRFRHGCMVPRFKRSRGYCSPDPSRSYAPYAYPAPFR